VLEGGPARRGGTIGEIEDGSKPEIARPLWRSTTTYSVVAATSGRAAAAIPRASSSAHGQFRFRRRRAAVIVLSIIWRFGCVRAAKLGYPHDGGVKPRVH